METRLTIGGKELVLKPLKLIDGVELEEELGKDFFTGKSEMSLKELHHFVYVILKRADKTITKEWVGENVDLNNADQMSTITSFFAADSTPTKK